MKPKLKHLAPYLPYGLKVRTPHGQCELTGSFHSDFKTIHIDEVLRYKHLKPILRPLSDLNKKIEVNGEEFTPIERLGLENSKEALESILFVVSELHVPYTEMIKLFEWHFDVFGLIEKGLAIDINTI